MFLPCLSRLGCEEVMLYSAEMQITAFVVCFVFVTGCRTVLSSLIKTAIP